MTRRYNHHDTPDRKLDQVSTKSAMGRRKPNENEEACASRRHLDSRSNRRNDHPRPEDSGLSDPAACISACRDQFILARTGETGDDFEEICSVLSQAQHNDDLRELYTCDATYCGVANCAADLDPNVDLIINVCQSLHFYAIFDPGPPTDPRPDLCRDEANSSSETEPSCSPTGPSALAEPLPDGRRTTVLGDSRPSTASLSTTSATPTSSVPGGTNSPNTAPNVAAPSDAVPTGLSTGGKAAIGICSGIALLSILLLILFIIRRRRKDRKVYLRAADQPPHLSRPPSRPASGAFTPLITPPPSASSRNPPSTPPARLSNRKFLPLMLRQADTAQSSPSSLYPPPEYQDSPTSASPAHVSSGYYNKLFPPQSQNHERRQTPMPPLGNTTTADMVPDSPLPPPPPPVVVARDSAASLGNYPVVTGERSASRGENKANSVDSGTATVAETSTPPVSPSWAPASSLAQDLPDFAAAPLGPPPNRALPPTPLQGYQQQQQRQYQVSPTSTLSLSPLSLTFPQHQRHPSAAEGALTFGSNGTNVEKPPLQLQQQTPSAIGLAVAPPTPSPTCTIIAAPKASAGHVHNHSSTGSREDLSARDLRELTESYARETRESWGSWSGAGGGGPGIGGGGGNNGGFGGTGGKFRKGSNGSPRSSGSVAGGPGAAVAMRDLDLEKLGGSYR